MLALPLGVVVFLFVVVSSTCTPAVPTVLLSLSSDFGSSPSLLFPLFPPHWLVGLLLGYYVGRYLAVDSISVGYAVLFPWE